MRIVLDARNITDQPAGVARYATSLIPQLIDAAPEHEYVVLRHDSWREPLEALSGRPQVREVFCADHIGKPRDFAAGALGLGRVFARVGRPDVYHNLFHVSPLGLRHLGPWTPRRVVVTLHDLIWIEHALASQRTVLKAVGIRAFASVAIPRSLRQADHVICVSQATAEAASRWLDPSRMSVILHGVDARYHEAQPAPQGLVGALGCPYVVAVGNDKPYKNLAVLLRAYARVRSSLGPSRLVLVGACQGLAPLIEALGLGDSVVLAGFVHEPQLRAILAHARLFVFPSLIEGFGLPPLEAMALGTPTLVSDLEPMRSVVGQGAQRFDPRDPGQLARQLARCWGDAALRDALRERGQARARALTWDQAARKTLRCYGVVR